MGYQAKLITAYQFRPSDLLLLDTNVWFYIYGPTNPQNPHSVIYSKALRDILAAKSQIYVDVLIVSEFVNRYARLEHQLLMQRSPGTSSDYKIFRQSSSFKPIAKVITTAVKRFLNLCHRTENGFNTCDIVKVFDEYAKSKADFNDLMLIQLCQDQGLKLVTHDRDFKGKNITLLTANKQLRNCLLTFENFDL